MTFDCPETDPLIVDALDRLVSLFVRSPIQVREALWQAAKALQSEPSSGQILAFYAWWWEDYYDRAHSFEEVQQLLHGPSFFRSLFRLPFRRRTILEDPEIQEALRELVEVCERCRQATQLLPNQRSEGGRP